MQGQEPLLEQNLLDAFRASWQKQEIERQRHDINNVNDWKMSLMHSTACPYFQVSLPLKFMVILSPMLML